LSAIFVDIIAIYLPICQYFSHLTALLCVNSWTDPYVHKLMFLSWLGVCSDIKLC